MIHSNPRATLTLQTNVIYISAVAQYVAAPLAEKGIVGVYDSTGAFVTTLLHAGSGAGELTQVRMLVAGLADTIIVLGYGDRVVRLSLRTGTTADSRSERLAPRAATVRKDGGLLLNAEADTLPNFVVLDGHSRITTAFGERTHNDPNDLLYDSRALASYVTVDSMGNIWTVPQRYRLQLQEWSSSGRLLRTVDRKASWFEESRPDTSEGPALEASQVRPKPRAVGLMADEPNRLWLFAMVADAKWKQTDPIDLAHPLMTLKNGIPTWTYSDWSRQFDGIVEVFDTRTDRVLARVRTDFEFGAVVGPHLLGMNRMRPDGDAEYIVYRLGLVNRGAGIR